MLLTLLGNQSSVPVDPPVVPDYVWASAWGMSWGDSWGNSWGPLHEVDELRRPRTHPNLKFTGIREGRGVVRGSCCSAAAGRMQARGSRDAPLHHVRQEIVGYGVRAGTIGVRSRGVARSSVQTKRGIWVDVGRVAGHRGAQVVVRGAAAAIGVCKVGSRGEARGSITSEDTFSFAGHMSARGVRNPTDEQLAHIAHLLTRKRF